MKNIVELFLNAATEYPDNIAIIEKNKQISYRQLARSVKETTAFFRKKGIKSGDRVLVFVPMSIDLYRIVLALFHIGATAVFLDEWVSRKRMELCCRLADCRAFIGIWKARIYGRFFSKELKKIPIRLGTRFQKSSSLEEPENVSLDHTALITFTTGSTGTPKAARRTHGFLKEQFDALIEKMQPQVNDVDLSLIHI